MLEYAARDRSRGFVGVFKLTNGSADYALRLRGADLHATYDVTLDNSGKTFRVSGQELRQTGIAIRLDAANTSELVMCRRAGRSYKKKTVA